MTMLVHTVLTLVKRYQCVYDEKTLVKVTCPAVFYIKGLIGILRRNALERQGRVAPVSLV